MAYSFNFDLSKFSQNFFRDLAKFSERNRLHKKLGSSSRKLMEKFRVHKLTGLPVAEASMIVEDLMDTYIRNLTQKEIFSKTKKRALLMPHCSRKYMDQRCKARFNAALSYYQCRRCSPDCSVNKATVLAKKKGYDIFILPGGSCVRKLLATNKYDGVVGVACCEEIKLAAKLLELNKIPFQAVPLIKNGCSGTKFRMETLEAVMA
jgi:hypothetical protein